MDKKLIYAADDEENIREILQAFLEEAGYAVRVFETGDSLLQAFADRPADMVILDIMMPGTDGISVCKKLREISSVPIIILTAKESEMDYAIGITSGGDDYLIKPFRPSILVMRMKALFRRIEMERGSRQDRESASFGDISYYKATGTASRSETCCHISNCRTVVTGFCYFCYSCEIARQFLIARHVSCTAQPTWRKFYQQERNHRRVICATRLLPSRPFDKTTRQRHASFCR